MVPNSHFLLSVPSVIICFYQTVVAQRQGPLAQTDPPRTPTSIIASEPREGNIGEAPTFSHSCEKALVRHYPFTC